MKKYSIEHDFSVVFTPPFHDSELFFIKMSLDEIELNFISYENESDRPIVRILGKRPKQLQFTSDHLQNVVDQVFVFKRGDTVRAENDILGLQIISDLKLQKLCDSLQNGQVLLVVSPITGPELVSVIEEIEIQKL